MNTKFFASANSYNGFYSLFDEIFKSEEYEKIFVIKGGPGTGKSSLINSVSKFAEKNGGKAEYYYCSSDVNSLDGSIIDICGKRFAIIDGTAPHQRDAIYPSAVDEIVNLTDNLDASWIEAQREKIITLSLQKSRAYKTAYSYLRLSGKCHEEINNKMIDCFCELSAQKFISNLSDMTNLDDKKSIRRRFISSFSKDGYKSFHQNSSNCQIGGSKICSQILLKYILDTLHASKLEMYPSPLVPNLPEKLIINEKYSIGLATDISDIESDKFFNITKSGHEEVRLAKKMEKEFLSEASRWLSIASDIHFQLEDIYKNAMNFEKNNVVFDKICKKILKVCDYSS